MKAEKLWMWIPNSAERGKAYVQFIQGLSDTNSVKLARGQRITVKPSLTANLDRDSKKFDDNLGSYKASHLVSAKLAKVVKKYAGARVQLLPIRIQRNSKLKYFVANFLDSIDLVDKDRSKILYYEGTDTIRKIDRVILQKNDNLPFVFHLSELAVLLIKDEFKKALEEAVPKPGRFAVLKKWPPGF